MDCTLLEQKQYRLKNIEAVKLRDKRKYLARRERVIEQAKRSYEANKEKKLAYAREYRQKNSERIAALQKKYRLDNKEKLRAGDLSKFHRYKKTGHPVYLALVLRKRTRCALKAQGARKSAKTEELLGCTWAIARAHISSLFKDGMSWENHGTWHIDHIRPLASFDLKDPAQQKIACHYSNLQPLWKLDNIRKGAKHDSAI
jgi:hypothetical protein